MLYKIYIYITFSRFFSRVSQRICTTTLPASSCRQGLPGYFTYSYIITVYRLPSTIPRNFCKGGCKNAKRDLGWPGPMAKVCQGRLPKCPGKFSLNVRSKSPEGWRPQTSMESINWSMDKPTPVWLCVTWSGKNRHVLWRMGPPSSRHASTRIS